MKEEEALAALWFFFFGSGGGQNRQNGRQQPTFNFHTDCNMCATPAQPCPAALTWVGRAPRTTREGAQWSPLDAVSREFLDGVSREYLRS